MPYTQDTTTAILLTVSAFLFAALIACIGIIHSIKKRRDEEQKTLIEIYTAQIEACRVQNTTLFDRLFYKANLPPTGTDMAAERVALAEREANKPTKSGLQLPNNGIDFIQRERQKAFDDVTRKEEQKVKAFGENNA